MYQQGMKKMGYSGGKKLKKMKNLNAKTCPATDGSATLFGDTYISSNLKNMEVKCLKLYCILLSYY